jgi:hypothetical protein
MTELPAQARESRVACPGQRPAKLFIRLPAHAVVLAQRARQHGADPGTVEFLLDDIGVRDCAYAAHEEYLQQGEGMRGRRLGRGWRTLRLLVIGGVADVAMLVLHVLRSSCMSPCRQRETGLDRR